MKAFFKTSTISVLALLGFGCSQLIKTQSEMSCEDAAAAYNDCLSVSPNLEAPKSFNALTAALACEGQPDCLAGFFNCTARAFSSADCSTEEGSNAAMEAAAACELPESDPDVCPIDDLLGLPDECGGTPPIIVDASCSYPGVQFSDADGEELPLITILVNATDADADLTEYELDLIVDRVVDGQPDANASSYTVTGQPSTRNCDTDGANITLDFFLKGGFPAFETEYEWYFVVRDAAGLSSDQYMITCKTPDEQGNPP